MARDAGPNIRHGHSYDVDAILIYSSAGPIRHLMQALTEVRRPARSVSDWTMFRQPAAGRVVIAPELTSAIIPNVNYTHERDPMIPIILITRFETSNLLKLARLMVSQVASWEESPAEWTRAIDVALSASEQTAFAARIHKSLNVPNLVRIAMVRLALANPPLRTVQSLARSLGYAESTLRAHFKALSTDYRLEDVVDWFILLHYGWLHASHHRARPSSADQPPTARTLDAMAGRLLGRSRHSMRRPHIDEFAGLRLLLDPGTPERGWPTQ